MFHTLGITAYIRVSVSDLEGWGGMGGGGLSRELAAGAPTQQLLIQLKLRLVIVINHNLKLLTLSLMFLNISCENRVRKNTVILY